MHYHCAGNAAIRCELPAEVDEAYGDGVRERVPARSGDSFAGGQTIVARRFDLLERDRSVLGARSGSYPSISGGASNLPEQADRRWAEWSRATLKKSQMITWVCGTVGLLRAFE